MLRLLASHIDLNQEALCFVSNIIFSIREGKDANCSTRENCKKVCVAELQPEKYILSF